MFGVGRITALMGNVTEFTESEPLELGEFVVLFATKNKSQAMESWSACFPRVRPDPEATQVNENKIIDFDWLWIISLISLFSFKGKKNI